jgi:lactate permease
MPKVVAISINNGVIVVAPPVDLLYWGLGIAPLALLLVTLVVLRWQAHEAASVGMFAAVLVGLTAYQTPLRDIAVASGKGVWDAVFVLYVIIPALIFYHIIDRANGFDALREEVKSVTSNELFLVLGFGWVFVSFMQSISGFGTPIVVVAPILLALGVKPVYSVVIPLVGHAWANTFGTLGVAWLALDSTVELQAVLLTAAAAGVLLWVVNLAGGLTVAWIFGRKQAVKYALPMIALVSLIHGGGQLLGIFVWEPAFANFMAATLGLLALPVLAKWDPYADTTDDIDVRPAMRDDMSSVSPTGSGTVATDGGVATEMDAIAPDDLMDLKLALLPFGVLAAIAFLTAVIDPLAAALNTVQAGLSFPAVETGFGVANGAAAPYAPFTPLTHPGTLLLASTAVAYAVYKRKGYFDTDTGTEESLTRSVLETAIPASVAVISFLVMAKVMDNTGQTLVLAQGIANVATPASYGFLSPLIGSLGAFMTSSNTASNILFSGLQQETATSLGGLSENWILGGQTTGGAIGNAISPGNVILGTSAVGIVGKEGEVLRRTIPWVAAVAAIVGLLIVLFNAVGFLGVA